MTKRSASPEPRPAAGEPSVERQFAEEFGAVGASTGMPRMSARLLGWMLICQPPRQSLGEIARALGVSRASVSIATRLLQASGLLRRVAVPGARGYVFEADPSIFVGQMDAANPFGALRAVLDRGVSVAGGEADPRAARLRQARDFYAYVEREIPALIARYRAEREAAEGGDR
jgi:DNA-binding Lrp family transcriptional regulator